MIMVKDWGWLNRCECFLSSGSSSYTDSKEMSPRFEIIENPKQKDLPVLV